MLSEEGFALAMAEAEEHDVYLFKRHVAGKAHVGVAIESFVHICQEVSGVALAVYECDLCLRMI